MLWGNVLSSTFPSKGRAGGSCMRTAACSLSFSNPKSTFPSNCPIPAPVSQPSSSTLCLSFPLQRDQGCNFGQTLIFPGSTSGGNPVPPGGSQDTPAPGSCQGCSAHRGLGTVAVSPQPFFTTQMHQCHQCQPWGQGVQIQVMS